MQLREDIGYVLFDRSFAENHRVRDLARDIQIMGPGPQTGIEQGPTGDRKGSSAVQDRGNPCQLLSCERTRGFQGYVEGQSAIRLLGCHRECLLGLVCTVSQ